MIIGHKWQFFPQVNDGLQITCARQLAIRGGRSCQANEVKGRRDSGFQPAEIAPAPTLVLGC